MSSIYIHIPFCKQACYYCDFHFSINLNKKDEMVLALAKELNMRKNELEGEVVETIYFGGGTPSILSIKDIEFLIDEVYKNYKVIENPEITLEANPDDLTYDKILQLANLPINRLSIGIQSFFDDDLKLMNRVHNAQESKKCLETATQFFKNITIDLIYGIPNMSNQKWLQNIETALSFKVPHISAYALTVEPNTALERFIIKGKIPKPTDKLAQKHFQVLVNTLQDKGYIQYEISNFGKPNYFSRCNSAYWLGKKYIGIGPSAHSYNQIYRSWNINKNAKYIQSIKSNILPLDKEMLSATDKYNEYVMTGLRTIWGVSLEKIENEFGKNKLDYLLKQSQKHINKDFLFIENNVLKVSVKGKFFSDGIASDLFLVNLK